VIVYTRFLKPYNDETHPGVLLFTMASIPTTDTYGMNLNVSVEIFPFTFKNQPSGKVKLLSSSK